MLALALVPPPSYLCGLWCGGLMPARSCTLLGRQHGVPPPFNNARLLGGHWHGMADQSAVPYVTVWPWSPYKPKLEGAGPEASKRLVASCAQAAAACASSLGAQAVGGQACCIVLARSVMAASTAFVLSFCHTHPGLPFTCSTTIITYMARWCVAHMTQPALVRLV